MTKYIIARALLRHAGAESWEVYKITSSGGRKAMFIATGSKANERAEYVRALLERERSADDERFLQRLFAGDKAADSELREIVGAQPRSTTRGRERGAFAA